MRTPLAELLESTAVTADDISDREYIASAFRGFVESRRASTEFRQRPSLMPERSLSSGELRALQRVGLATDVSTSSDADRARKEALRVFFLAYRTALSTKAVAKMLGVTTSRLRQRVANRTLIALVAGSELKFPAIQFEGGAEVPGLKRVLPILPRDLKPIAALSWLTTPMPELENESCEPRSPRDFLLATGEVLPVLNLAKILHDGGAA